MMALIRKQKPYEAQLKRIQRWKDRIDKILNDYKQGVLSTNHIELADMIWCFFICCDHLKDYISKDDTIKTKQSPYNYLDNNEYLKICRDISAGTKHLKIKDPKTSGGPFKINFTGKRDQETEKMLVDVNIKSKTVYENFSKLARNCISAWEAYIKKEITSIQKKQILIKCPKCKKEFKIDEDIVMCDCPYCAQENILTGVKL